MAVHRYRVLSGAIRSLGSDEETAVLDVAPAEVLGLRRSDSIGRWSGTHNRPGHAARRIA